ncbi:SMP-30/gluconolactonase/LRE family protein [Bradyrhizobium sp. WSM 1704]|uniref:SMP-30/gluconolactonase/LRE family protein n=1 Tax=Bradyrhizobium semiaridum TaxID=2821404 RepID=UPI001CE26864|nr:SMP-30/gluconolactonase/LRE family protein [Bradyrhizobium semiaridum]MCA6121270.1 SMP-30/gluconolactonase/LRE family protein [Bradyrhizobium semiaridum]
MTYEPIVRMDKRVDGLISSDAKLEAVVTGFGFTEGVTWINAGPDSHLLFSDIPANVIYRWQPGHKAEIYLEKTGYQGADVWRVGMPFTNGKASEHPQFEQFNMFGSNGLTLDQEGRLIIATWGGRSIVRVERDGRRSVLADKYQGKRFGGPNDVVVRKDGSIYFTDTFGGMLKLGDDPSCEIDINAIYMIRNGDVVRVIDDIPNTNGLAFSPDEKVLYANGSIDNYIRRYDVLDDGTVANGRMFADLREETGIGITDGMRVDERGNLWSAGPGGVWIISPEGTRLGRIPLPEGGTNLVFGGADRRTVFVSCPTTIYRIDTLVAGAR